MESLTPLPPEPDEIAPPAVPLQTEIELLPKERTSALRRLGSYLVQELAKLDRLQQTERLRGF
ncbi:MAG TPA: hypothetical protein VFI84_03280 [Candidatus Saccharimonadales bacterium]|nr:hypothetical protein [Candidatus Saccharimonadales bacterium]